MRTTTETASVRLLALTLISRKRRHCSLRSHLSLRRARSSCLPRSLLSSPQMEKAFAGPSTAAAVVDSTAALSGCRHGQGSASPRTYERACVSCCCCCCCVVNVCNVATTVLNLVYKVNVSVSRLFSVLLYVYLDAWYKAQEGTPLVTAPLLVLSGLL